jgi:hypothetical protein
LGATFPDWLDHLERWEWVEYAVAGWSTPPDLHELHRYYVGLNPDLKVPEN